MVRKLSFIIISSILLICISSNLLYAEVKSVRDCLESNEDCEELQQQPAVEMEGNNELVENEGLSSSFVFNFIKMIFALLLILALIYVILNFIKKRNKLFSNVNVLENLGGITVGANKSIQIVRIGSKIYLFGVGDNVEMLQEITDDEIIDSLLTEEDAFKPATFLQGFMQKKTINASNKESVETSFTNTLEEELNKIKEKRGQMIDYYNEKDDRHG